MKLDTFSDIVTFLQRRQPAQRDICVTNNTFIQDSWRTSTDDLVLLQVVEDQTDEDKDEAVQRLHHVTSVHVSCICVTSPLYTWTFSSSQLQNSLVTLVWCIWGEFWILVISQHQQTDVDRCSSAWKGASWGGSGIWRGCRQGDFLGRCSWHVQLGVDPGVDPGPGGGIISPLWPGSAWGFPSQRDFG